MQNEQGFDLAGRILFVALPAYDHKLSLKLAISLARFAQTAPQHGISIHFGSICGCSVVSKARNRLVADFLESDATDLLFIDSDINFEPEAILRLMAFGGQDKKKGIVAGVPRVRDKDTRYITNLGYDGEKNLTMNGMGLVQAEDVATAFMWVRREVFEEMGEAHPEWTYWDDAAGRDQTAFFHFEVRPRGYIGEDFLFCERTRELGYQVWIDPSITLGHMGIQEYVGNFGDDVLYPMMQPEQE
jgi:hypothetical protein